MRNYSTGNIYSFLVLFIAGLLPSLASAQYGVDFNTTYNTNCNGAPCNYNGPSILINEIMMSPNAYDGSIWGGLATQGGEWIELYNPNICESIDISCYYLGNNAPGPGGDYPGGYVIPPGTVVPPAGFALIRGIRAPPVPPALLVENGGSVVELEVTDPNVCVNGGTRLWFPNSGGWFGFYDSNGVPQDAVSWASQNNSELPPCVPPFTGCNYAGPLSSYDDFQNDRKTYITNQEADEFQGFSQRRIPDGGAWGGFATPTYGSCNTTCVDTDFLNCNGSALAEPLGGTPPYSYLWDDPQSQTTQLADNLCAGTFCVLVTDALGITSQVCVTIEDAFYETDISDGFCEGDTYTLPDNTTVSAPGTYPIMFQTDTSCDSLVTVELEMYPVYDFVLDPEICANQVYTLPDGTDVQVAGNYVVPFQTIHGCDSIYNVNLTVNPPVNIPVSAEICSGTIYELPDGTEVGNAGIYNVLMPGGQAACDTLYVVELQLYPTFDLNLNSRSDISCFGQTDGAVDLSINGTTGPYAITWSDGVNHGFAPNNLEAGDYDVQVTDVHGCTSDLSFNIAEPSPISITATADTLICIGTESQLVANATGGTGAFTYHWSHTTSNNATSNVSPVTDTGYNVIATDANDCISPIVFLNVAVISMDSALLQTTAGDPVCSGGESTVEAFYDGAYPPYTYVWNQGLPDGPGPHTVSPDDTTTYELTVSDDCGNEVNDQVTITIWPLPVADIDHTNVTCNGFDDGTAQITLSEGTPDFTFIWSDGQNHGVEATDLSPGDYTVEIADANGCESDTSFTITQPQPLVLKASADSLICIGSESQLLAQAVGGTAPFVYHWSHTAATNNADTVSPATDTGYNVYTTDANNCVSAVEFLHVAVISMDDSLLEVTAGDPVCAGGETTLEAFYDGAYPPYTYVWNQGLPNGPGPHTISPDETTTYELTVSDDCGNEVNEQVTITIWPLPVADINLTNVTCNGFNDATAQLSLTEGTPGFTFAWSDGLDHGNNATGLSPGNYTVDISDSNGCELDLTFDITEPQPLSITASADTLICIGSASELTAQAAGGTSPFTYHWSHTASANATSSVSPDTDTEYTVYATDANDCTTDVASLQVDVISMNIASLEITAGNPVCSGGETTLEAFYDGDYPPYTYTWNQGLPNGPGPHTISPEETTTYNLTVTDDCGNEVNDEITINIWSLPLAELTSTNVTCNGYNDGTAQIALSEGTPEYNLTWSDGEDHGDDATGLSPGDYTVEIADANGCATDVFFTITQPDPLALKISVDSLICIGSASQLRAQAIGGTGPFTYHWSHTASTNNTSSVSPDTDTGYTVYAADAYGCTSEVEFLDVAVISMDITSLEITVGEPVCSGGETTVEAFYDGTYPPYTYVWNQGLPNGPGPHTLAPDETTTYQLTVSDDCGNEVSDEISITIWSLPIADITFTDVSCHGLNNGTAQIAVSEGTPDYTFSWSDGLNHGIDATELSPGYYTVDISDANGCETDLSFNITQPQPLSLSASADTLICIGSESQLLAQATGGTGLFTYQWSHSASINNTISVSPETDTGYTVYATDENGCNTQTILLQVNVISMDAGLLHISNDTAICEEQSAQITASYSGTYPPYEFTWSHGLMNSPGPHTITPDLTTTYELSVTDRCDNNLDTSVTVTVYALPEISLSGQLINGCSPFSTALIDSVNTAAGYTHEWTTTQSGSLFGNPATLQLTEPGLYEVWLLVTSPDGCTDTSDTYFPVNVLPLPEANFSASPWSADINNPEIAFTNTSQDFVSGTWFMDGAEFPGETDISYSFPDTGRYPIELLVENEFGCLDSITQYVTIGVVYDIVLPNAFVPSENGDNPNYDPLSTSNSVFYAFADYVEEYRMSIFNRWGELIFESDEFTKGWNGTYRGAPCPQDVYVYRIDFVFADGHEITKVGDITLFR